MFSKIVTEALIEAGWNPNRKIDITQYENALAREGYADLPQVLKDFLAEFGGLRLKTPHFTDITPAIIKQYPALKEYKRKPYQEMHFDVIEAMGTPIIPMTKEEIFEERIGENMFYFGEIWDGRYYLAMTSTGKIYGRDGHSILLLGNDYVEMLENEFNRIRPIEIE